MRRRGVRTKDPRVLVHVSPVELGKIDVLIHDGYIRTRAHFLRVAVQHALRQYEGSMEAAITRHGFLVGTVRVDADTPPIVKVIGTAFIEPNAVPHIEQLIVFGVVEASGEVVAALGDRLVTRPYAMEPPDQEY